MATDELTGYFSDDPSLSEISDVWKNRFPAFKNGKKFCLKN